jgi:hypothetical protein
VIDAYKIGVSIAMTNGVSSVLSVIQRDVLGLKHKVDLTSGSFDRMKLAALGFTSVVAGGAVLGALAKLTEHGREFIQQQSAMKQAGIGQADIALAAAAAWKMSHDVMTTGATENLKLLQDLRNTLGSMDEGIAVGPAMAKVNAVIANITGHSAGDAGFQFARFLELRGALVDPKTGQIDASRLSQQAREGEAIGAGTAGRVGPRDLLAFQQQARVSGMSLTDAGVVNLVPLIQAMGGARAGTALNSTGQQLLGAVQLTRHAVEQLERIGLVDAHKVQEGRGGKMVLGDGALVNSDLMRHDMAAWVWSVLVPQMKSHGISTTDGQMKFLQSSGLRTTVIGLLTELVRNETAFKKDIGNINTAGQVDQYQTMAASSPDAKMAAFTAAWHNLLTALGSPMVDTAYDMLGKIAAKINDLALYASQHPDAVLAIEKVAAAIGGVLVVMGTAAVATAAVAALGVLAGPTGLLALAAGIAALASAVPHALSVIEHPLDSLRAWTGAGPDVPGGVNTWHDKRLPLSLPSTGLYAPKTLVPDMSLERESRGDGAGGNGSGLLHRESYIPPSSGGKPVTVQTIVYLDKRVLARAISDQMAHSASLPPSGGTMFNPRLTPQFPSNAVSI